MKVYACGDSFISTDPNCPNRHFTEILNCKSLARPGVGNIDICFQIKQSIAESADFVIIGTTDSARIEIPVGTKKNYSNITLSDLRPGPTQKYISDTIPTFIGKELDLQKKYDLNLNVRTAVEQYFCYVYDDILKMQVDLWAIGFWLVELTKKQIPYFVLPRSFCIYEYAAGYPHEPWVFHTDFPTQVSAAEQLQEKIKNFQENKCTY